MADPVLRRLEPPSCSSRIAGQSVAKELRADVQSVSRSSDIGGPRGILGKKQSDCRSPGVYRTLASMCILSCIVPAFYPASSPLPPAHAGASAGDKVLEAEPGRGVPSGRPEIAPRPRGAYSGHHAIKIEPVVRADTPYPALTFHLVNPSSGSRVFMHVYSVFPSRRTSIFTFVLPQRHSIGAAV